MTEQFNPVDADIVQHAMLDAERQAKDLRERAGAGNSAPMADVADLQAEGLLRVRNKILDHLPEMFAECLVMYPDYRRG